MASNSVHHAGIKNWTGFDLLTCLGQEVLSALEVCNGEVIARKVGPGASGDCYWLILIGIRSTDDVV